mgnify:CR=1 FL=1
MPDEKAHVMVAEDDPRTRLCLCNILREEGYRVTTSENGYLALQQINALHLYEGGVDFLILDIHMPGLTGLEVAERLAARKSKIPMAVITGDTDPHLAEQLKAAGCDHIFIKPFDLHVLLDTLKVACPGTPSAG